MQKAYDAIVVGGGPSGATPQRSWRGPVGGSPWWRRPRSRGGKCAVSSFPRPPGRCCAELGVAGPLLAIAGARRAPRRRLRRGERGGGAAAIEPGTAQRAGGRSVANTSTRCC